MPRSRYILPIQLKLNIHCSEPFFELYKIHECLQHYLFWDRPKHGIILRLVPPYLGLFLRWGTLHNKQKYIFPFFSVCSFAKNFSEKNVFEVEWLLSKIIPTVRHSAQSTQLQMYFRSSYLAENISEKTVFEVEWLSG